MDEVRSYCRICAGLCGIVVETDGERVTKVRGDRSHPLSRGYLCPKGRALASVHDHPGRLDVPEMRGRGEKLRRVGWEECLDDLAARLAAVRAESGPDAIATYISTGSFMDALGGRMAFAFATAVGTASRYSAVSVDSPCKPLVSEMMAGRPGLMPSLDRERATLSVLIGVNPVVSHGHYEGFADPVTRLRELASDGRELWVVDPRRTESARLATRHLQLKPGTDWALLAYAVRALLFDGGADEAYLSAHASGLEELRAAVGPVDLAEAQRRTGLAESELTEFVDAIRRHGSVAAQTGTGTTMSEAANVTEWLTWALHIVVASYDRPGGMWFNPGFLTCHDRRRVPEARPWEPSPGPPSRPDLPGRLGEYPSAALADEISSGNVRALVVMGGNPFNALPDPDRLARLAAERLEVLAVADVAANETSALATHVLPCTGQLERADVTYFADQYLPEVAAMYTPAVLRPRAQRRPAWRIFAELGSRLGFDLLPENLDPEALSEDDLLAPLVDRGRRPFAELASAGVLVDEHATFGWVERTLPDGRWRLAPAPLVAQLATLRARNGPSSIVVIPRRQMRHLNSAMRAVTPPGGRPDEPDVVINPLDARRVGVKDGGPVAVVSAHGRFVARARVSDDVRSGSVSVPHGWNDEASVGRLISGSACDPLTGMPLQSGVPVALEPVEE